MDQPWVEPLYFSANGTITLGVETSHGPDITMSLPADWISSTNWETNYTRSGADGSVTVQIVCIIETVSGDVFRMGARTINVQPWIVPVVNGKGRGRGRAPPLPAPAS